jgi:hypothetical protein
MRRHFFLCIVTEVEDYEPYFVQERNAAGILGFYFLQKIIAALKMLAYGVTGDHVDEYLRWWKVNSTRYPRLSLMARDFLTMQATSVALEV